MFSRRICGPRKVIIAISFDNGIKIIDPAVTSSDLEIAEYRKSLFDTSKLQIVGDPTWWTIAPLTRRQKEYVETFATSRARAAWIVRCGLTAIENYKIVNDKGELVETPQPERKDMGSLGLVATEAWLDKIDLPEDLLAALMIMIKEISEASGPFYSV